MQTGSLSTHALPCAGIPAGQPGWGVAPTFVDVASPVGEVVAAEVDAVVVTSGERAGPASQPMIATKKTAGERRSRFITRRR